MIEFQNNKDETIVNTWRPVKLLNGDIAPALTDSNGDVFGIETHIISDDGKVSPSVVCPYECGFHDFVNLIGWKHISKKNIR